MTIINKLTYVGKHVDKREPLCSVGGIVNWCNHYGKTVWEFRKKLKTELPFDPVIPLLGVYLKKSKTLIRKDVCTPMFTAGLFTIAVMWKRPRHPSTDK